MKQRRLYKWLMVMACLVFMVTQAQGQVHQKCLSCHQDYKEMKGIVAGDFVTLSKKAGSFTVDVGTGKQVIKIGEGMKLKHANDLSELKESLAVLAKVEKKGEDLVASELIAKPKFDVPKEQLITLEENYRSTQPVLDFANAILSRALYGYHKRLTSRQPEGPRPALIRAEDERQQSLFVVQQVLELREQGTPLSEMAVLARAAHLFFDLEIELARAGIPYRKFGGTKFTETAHVKDLLAFARIVDNSSDVISWYLVLLLLEGIGPRTARRIVEALRSGPLRWEDSASMEAVLAGISAAARSSLAELWELLRELALRQVPPPELLRRLAAFYKPLLHRRYDDHHKRWKDIEAVIVLAERYRLLREFLADLALEPPTESVLELSAPGVQDEAPLTLSTVHSAKGLEWSAVFLIWMTDGRFPIGRAYESSEALEEERRLFYVACTRSKRYLYVLYPVRALDSESGWVLSKPSPFLTELEHDGVAERWVLVSERSSGTG
jgi:DNA helicase-2/ATP-dependent DNA helicase PcrA